MHSAYSTTNIMRRLFSCLMSRSKKPIIGSKVLYKYIGQDQSLSTLVERGVFSARDRSGVNSDRCNAIRRSTSHKAEFTELACFPTFCRSAIHNELLPLLPLVHTLCLVHPYHTAYSPHLPPCLSTASAEYTVSRCMLPTSICKM